jgi:uncharacterized protein YqeY
MEKEIELNADLYKDGLSLEDYIASLPAKAEALGVEIDTLIITTFKDLHKEAMIAGDTLRKNLFSSLAADMQRQHTTERKKGWVPADLSYLDQLVRTYISGIEKSVAGLDASDARIPNLLTEKTILSTFKQNIVVKAVETLTADEEILAIGKIWAETKANSLGEIMSKLRDAYGKEKLNGKATVDRVNAFLRSVL